MTYGIFNLDSGNALAWYDSQPEALAAVGKLLGGEPDSAESVGLMEFDDNGHPTQSLLGQELAAAAGAKRAQAAV
jgi:hypothetical protein